MGRILGMDFGTKRVGLAVTDPLQIAAHGLTTVPSADCLDYIMAYASAESLEKIVIGIPPEPSRAFQRALDRLVNALHERTPDIEIVFEDEDFTSEEARAVMMRAGVKKKDRAHKPFVDQVSAILILQRHLGHLNPTP
ncbi:MAG: Holliday junction resolvase RuvX [Saprospiraceae bacterium]|nr:Holliday junction resolvase RuvX [Saprospiraceae bacterium]